MKDPPLVILTIYSNYQKKKKNTNHTIHITLQVNHPKIHQYFAKYV